MQGAIEGQLVCGTAIDRHAFPFQVCQLFNSRCSGGREVGFRPAAAQQQAGWQTVGFADNRRQIAEIDKIELPVGQRFIHRRAGALKELPLHLHTLRFKHRLQLMTDKGHPDRPFNKRFAAGALIRHANANGAQALGLRAGNQRNYGNQRQRGTGKNSFHHWW